MNWVDLAVILVVAYFAYQGVRTGFVLGFLELLGILVSLAIPFLLYGSLARLLIRRGASPVYADAEAFMATWVVTIVLYFVAVRRLYRVIPPDVRASGVNRVFGVLTGAIKGVVVAAMLLALAVAVPNRLMSQQSIDGSRLSPPILDTVMAVSARSEAIFGRPVRNALGFLTVGPKDQERINLGVKTPVATIDSNAEAVMLRLVNGERTSRGLKPLVMDESIRKVARSHSVDMLKNGYFSHESLDGRSPFDRMKKAGIHFGAAGENIAFAPTVRIAHAGLMKSPGHRANILNPSFKRIGIGAARGGRYRSMFTQDFTD